MERSDQVPTNVDLAQPSGTAGAWRAHFSPLIRDVAFFVLFYVFLWRVVEVRLIFHGAGLITDFPPFYTTWGFFTEHLAAPGGAVEYLSAFLSQLFYYSWLGALVVTIQAWMLGLCTAYLASTAGFKRWPLIRYAPALLLVILYGQYTYFVPTTMALLVALLCGCGHVAIAKRTKPTGSLIAFLVLSLICYYSAGGAFLLLAMVGGIYELTFTDRWRLGLGYVAIALGLPFVVGGLVFGQMDIYSKLLPISWTLLNYAPRRQWIELVYALYLLVPALMLIGGIWPILVSPRRDQKTNVPARKAKRPAPQNAGALKRSLVRYRQSPRFAWTVHTVVVLGVGLAIVRLGGFNAQKKRWMSIEYYASQAMWLEVLATARPLAYDQFVMHTVDRALYHTGQLGEKMFDWPQQPAYLFLSNATGKQVFWTAFDFYLEMGLINAAEHALTECLEGLGDRPMVLKTLALVNLVKGNIGTARVYLGTLSHTLFHRGWARHYLDLLETDPDLTTDRYIQQLRSMALERDFLAVAPVTPEMLAGLLEKNPANRMAFEYLMTSLLLNKQLATFTKYVQKFQELGYPAIPTCFEEAALAYVYGTRKPLYLGDYKPRVELRQQTEGFLKILKRHNGDRRAALPELAAQYRNTYMFYHMYAPVNPTP